MLHWPCPLGIRTYCLSISSLVGPSTSARSYRVMRADFMDVINSVFSSLSSLHSRVTHIEYISLYPCLNCRGLNAFCLGGQQGGKGKGLIEPCQWSVCPGGRRPVVRFWSGSSEFVASSPCSPQPFDPCFWHPPIHAPCQLLLTSSNSYTMPACTQQDLYFPLWCHRGSCYTYN